MTYKFGSPKIKHKQKYLVNNDWHATAIKKRIEMTRILRKGWKKHLTAIFYRKWRCPFRYIIYEKSTNVPPWYIETRVKTLPSFIRLPFLQLYLLIKTNTKHKLHYEFNEETDSGMQRKMPKIQKKLALMHCRLTSLHRNPHFGSIKVHIKCKPALSNKKHKKK